jgi:hypothetical protein
MADPRKQRSALYCPTLDESLIPWRNPESWAAAHQTILRLMDLYGERMAPAREIALRILSGLSRLGPVFDALCNVTCASCSDPCCRTADVRYDLRDLLFLHLTGQRIPDGQPRPKPGETCRYLRKDGCALERYARPWICTWNVCPAMKRRMRFGGKSEDACLQATIKDIGEWRKQMEDAFIRIVAG